MYALLCTRFVHHSLLPHPMGSSTLLDFLSHPECTALATWVPKQKAKLLR